MGEISPNTLEADIQNLSMIGMTSCTYSIVSDIVVLTTHVLTLIQQRK